MPASSNKATRGPTMQNALKKFEEWGIRRRSEKTVHIRASLSYILSHRVQLSSVCLASAYKASSIARWRPSGPSLFSGDSGTRIGRGPKTALRFFETQSAQIRESDARANGFCK